MSNLSTFRPFGPKGRQPSRPKGVSIRAPTTTLGPMEPSNLRTFSAAGAVNLKNLSPLNPHTEIMPLKSHQKSRQEKLDGLIVYSPTMSFIAVF